MHLSAWNRLRVHTTHAPQERLQCLQAFRGMAAVAVLLFHVTLIGNQFEPLVLLNGLCDHGHLGVDFFFVLSGFIIYHIHNQDLGEPKATRVYLLKRLMRVYPPLFVATTLKVVYIGAAGIGVSESTLSLESILASYLMLPMPDGRSPVIAVAWTLSHEMLFYSMFLLLIIVYRRWTAAILSAWVLAIAGVWCIKTASLGTNVEFILCPRNVQFVCGVATAWVFNSMPIPRWVANAVLLCSVLIGTIGLCHYGQVEQAGMLCAKTYWGVVFSGVVLGAAAIEAQRGAAVPRVLMLLGDASYSIYLWHTAGIQGAFVVWRKLWANVPLGDQVGLLCVAATAVGVGVAMYWCIERPMLVAGQKWLRCP